MQIPFMPFRSSIHNNYSLCFLKQCLAFPYVSTQERFSSPFPWYRTYVILEILAPQLLLIIIQNEVQLGIITVLGLGITEHVFEAGAAGQVTEEIGFEVEHFQVDIRLLHSYAISKNRQTAISLSEVLRLAKRAKLEFSLKPIVP